MGYYNFAEMHGVGMFKIISLVTSSFDTNIAAVAGGILNFKSLLIPGE